ncbi:MAG: VWA domain-containing protein [Alphaproteobacteria bacterium]|nr:VWA domain-containing protein [Alphaproteobacteria bacterium]
MKQTAFSYIARFLLLTVWLSFTCDAAAKSPPPGTGADDVPANILIMLDTSGSMAEFLPSQTTRYPIDVAFDSQGNSYVAEYYDTVKKYDSAGNLLAFWGGYSPAGADGQFDLISAIAVDSEDNIYVSDRFHRRIQKFDSNGNFITKMQLSVGPAQGVALDSNDNVYAINGSGNVQKFTKDGTPIGNWSISGGTNLAIDSSDRVYVAMQGNNRVRRYNTNGTLQQTINLPFGPFGIGLDENDDLYISAFYANTVYKYSAAGAAQGVWGGGGSGPLQFLLPAGIERDNNNNMYISDYLNNRVKRVDGTLLVQPGENLTRLQAAKDVIKSIVSNSNLTGGANFGLMKWDNTSQMVVNVADNGASQIYTAVDALTANGGTVLDNAMTLAQSYFLGANSPILSNTTCQENILIVISDGFWVDTTASATAESLNLNQGIKTFTVGFATAGNTNYLTLSQKGGTYPDSPLYADNKAELLDVLTNYIQQVISSSLTFTTPTIIPSTANDESILQSTFTYKSNHQWKGRLLKYELLDNGNVGDLLWDAGEELNEKTAANRNLWTVATALPQDLNNISAANIDRLRQPMEEYSGAPYTDEELTALIDFIRGMDSYDEFAADLDDEGTALQPDERWKLADIYHSKASIVGPPSAFFSDETNVNSESYYRFQNGYKAFKESSQCGGICADRKEVIYVGSNAGFMHAFDSETGEELWAFMPPSLLGNMKGLVSAADNSSNSIYGVDGSPTVKDIFYDGQWRTVLMAGLAQGGHSYFALDVTDPLAPTHLFTFASRTGDAVISYWDSSWTRMDFPTASAVPAAYDFRTLGEAWSQPVIVRIPIGGVDRWVALVGGGYNNGINPNYGAQLFVLDMEDGGKIINKIALTDGDPSNDIVNSVPPKVTAITADSTTLFTDRGAMAYITDLEGKLWQVNLSNQGTLYEKQTLFDAQANNDNDRYNFHELAATITSDKQLMLYFGTGNTQKLGQVSDDTQNRVYGIKEVNFPLYVPSSAFTVSAMQNTTDPAASCPDNAQKGWYIDLAENEKVTAKITVSNQTAFVSRYVPNTQNLCSPGTAKLTEVSFMCGGTLSDTTLGTGVPTDAVIYENKIYIGISDNGGTTELPDGFVKSDNLIVGDPSIILDGEVRIESWREDF